MPSRWKIRIAERISGVTKDAASSAAHPSPHPLEVTLWGSREIAEHDNQLLLHCNNVHDVTVRGSDHEWPGTRLATVKSGGVIQKKKKSGKTKQQQNEKTIILHKLGSWKHKSINKHLYPSNMYMYIIYMCIYICFVFRCEIYRGVFFF